MSRRLALSLVVLVAALLISPAAGAESAAPPVSKEAFLAGLEAPEAEAAPQQPAVTAAGTAPAPVWMACASQCFKCGTNKVKLCTSCNGVVTCGPCEGGTVCDI